MAPGFGSSWKPTFPKLTPEEKASLHVDLYSANGPHPVIDNEILSRGFNITHPVTIEALEDTMPDFPEGPMRPRNEPSGMEKAPLGLKAVPTPPPPTSIPSEQLVIDAQKTLADHVLLCKSHIKYHMTMLRHYEMECDKVMYFLSTDQSFSNAEEVDVRREELGKTWKTLEE